MADETSNTSISDESYAESQGLEIVSDADLQGIEEESTDAKADDAKADDAKADDAKADDAKADDAKADDAKADDAKADDAKADDAKADNKSSESKSESSKKEDKPGDSSSSKASDKDDASTKTSMVPLEALHESRNTIKFLKEQIKDLTTGKPKVEESKEEPVDDFKTLTETEFEKLAEDNPVEAMKYNMKLMQHNALINEKKASKESQVVATEYVNQVVNESLKAMEEVVPGIFDEESSVQKELVEYAGTLGFTDDMFYLTNPQTQIILPGETEPLLLGDQAVSMLKVLSSSRANQAKMKDDFEKSTPDEKAIEARIRKEVEAELVAKFKSGDKDSFKSIKQIQKTDGEMEFGEKVLTEAEFIKLTDKEQEAYLAGA